MDLQAIRQDAEAAQARLAAAKPDPELQKKLRMKRVREMRVALVENFRDDMVELVAAAGANPAAQATDKYRELKAGIEAAKPGGMVMHHADDVLQLCDWAQGAKHSKSPAATPAT